MSDNLDTMTDADLNAALSALLPPPEHKWVETHDADECSRCGLAKWQDGQPCRIWWTHNFREALALLERFGSYWHSYTGGIHEIQVGEAADEAGVPWAQAATFARAGVIAAIRALRAGATLT